jgi:integrase
MAERRANGTGSIFRDSRGYWTAQIACGYTPAGRVKYKKKRARTQGEVVAWMNAQTATAQGGYNLAPERVTVESYLKPWLAGVERAARYSTHKSYAQLCRDHIIPRIGKIQLSKIRLIHIQELLNALDDAGKARNTVRNVKACLQAALKGQEKEYPHAVAAVKNAKLPRKEKQAEPTIRALTPEQARIFLAAVEPERLKALYWVALLLGLREGEILGLRIIDIDLEKRTLRVAGAHQAQKGKGIVRVATKTEAGETLLPLPSALVPVLREHLAMLEEDRTYSQWREHGLLFPTTKGTPISARNLVRRFKKILEVNELPNIRFHDLRHSCATLLISLGVHPRVIMEILRHTQISTTMNLYGHAIPETSRAAVDQLGELVMPETLEIKRKVRK